MDKRVGSAIIIILGIFFAKITFEVSFADSRTDRRPAGIQQVGANEIPHEIR
jgi:hypothetical protein